MLSRASLRGRPAVYAKACAQSHGLANPVLERAMPLGDTASGGDSGMAVRVDALQRFLEQHAMAL
jgi:hypothetical protein